MSKSKNKLNGSVESLAASLHDVISEAVEKGNETMMGEMAAMEGRINKRMDSLESNVNTLKLGLEETNKSLKTTNDNMIAQFAAQKKFITDEVDKRLNK